MNEDNSAEEYYNCGYDGIYEPKEKAIIFKCVGRGLRLPPLSKIDFPSFVVMGYKRLSEDVRPSYSVLELLSSTETSFQNSDCNEKNENNHLSSHKYLVQLSSDILTESLSHPALSTVPHQSSKSEVCSPDTVKEVVLSEGSDSEDADNTTYNVNKAASGSNGKLLLDKNLKSFNDASLEARVSVHTTYTATKHKVIDQKRIWELCSNSSQKSSVTTKHNEDRNMQKPLCDNSAQIISSARNHKSTQKSFWDLPQTNSTMAEHQVCDYQYTWPQLPLRSEESYLSNTKKGQVGKMISESKHADYFNHFLTFKTNEPLHLDNLEEFPGLTTKQNHVKRSNPSFSTNQLKMKSENSLSKSIYANAAQISDTTSTIRQKGKTVPNHGVLTIENLPQNVNKECLKNFLMQFGEIHSIRLLLLPDRITAKIKIDAQLERIINFLDGSSPFGAQSQPLRCYQEDSF